MEKILKNHDLDYEIEWEHSGKPYLTQPGKLVDAMSNAINRVVGISPDVSTTGGTSDGRFIADISQEVIEFGPINESIHKINEHVVVGDIDRLKDIYKETLIHLLT